MVTIPQLGWLVAGFGIVACAVAWWRRHSLRASLFDLASVFLVVWAMFLLAAWAYSLANGGGGFAEFGEPSRHSAPVSLVRFLRNAGAMTMVLAPVVGALTLGRFRRRSFWRALGPGVLALALLAAWLVLYLKGPAGGWSMAEVLGLTAMGSSICGLALCAGSWTRRRQSPSGGNSLSGSMRDREARSSSVSNVIALIVLLGVVGLSVGLGGCAPTGNLTLTLSDLDTGEPTPARIELLDASGAAIVPTNALPIVSDCGMLPAHNWWPALGRWQAAWRRRPGIYDPYRQTEQFYVDGRLTTALAPGTYLLRVSRGPETRVETREVEIRTGRESEVSVQLDRWIDLPDVGWYSADDHLHIPRPSDDLDSDLAAWMEAEDLWVANFLQMGLAQDVHITPQFAFGAPSVFRGRRGLLVGGQENPRTHILGHSILLGARKWIDFPDHYALYPQVWRESHRHGGVNGYAHFALAAAEKGLALWGDRGLIDFIEVQNFGFPFYERWYESLNLGLRMTPTAGSDFPCVANLPGRDRFYTKIEGEFGYQAWLDSVRQGRTVVTNGPFVELKVDGLDVGSEIALGPGESVRIEGRVVFDPEVDRIERLELVQGGVVVATVISDDPGAETGAPSTMTALTDLDRARSVGAPPTELRLSLDHPVHQTTWLALRAFGTKLDEVRPGSLDLLKMALESPPSPSAAAVIDQIDAILGTANAPVAAAHSAAIYVLVEGSPALSEQPAARNAASRWLARLDEFEQWFSESGVKELAGFPGRGDGLSAEHLEAHREQLLDELGEARSRLESIVRDGS